MFPTDPPPGDEKLSSRVIRLDQALQIHRSTMERTRFVLAQFVRLVDKKMPPVQADTGMGWMMRELSEVLEDWQGQPPVRRPLADRMGAATRMLTAGSSPFLAQEDRLLELALRQYPDHRVTRSRVRAREVRVER
jgi:hypothetical protein